MADRRQAVDAKINQAVEDIVVRLKRCQLRGSFNVAKTTLEVFRLVLGYKKWKNTKELIATVRAIGRRLEAAQPIELSAGCMSRRVLHVIRTEHQKAVAEREQAGLGTHASDVPPAPTSARLLKGATPRPAMFGDDEDGEGVFDESVSIKSAVLGIISEIIDEMSSLHSQIAENAAELIHTKYAVHAAC